MKQRNNEQENYMIKPQEFQPLPCLLNYVVTPKMQSVKNSYELNILILW